MLNSHILVNMVTVLQRISSKQLNKRDNSFDLIYVSYRPPHSEYIISLFHSYAPLPSGLEELSRTGKDVAMTHEQNDKSSQSSLIIQIAL